MIRLILLYCIAVPLLIPLQLLDRFLKSNSVKRLLKVMDKEEYKYHKKINKV